jgi:hypothetical protein
MKYKYLLLIPVVSFSCMHSSDKYYHTSIADETGDTVYVTAIGPVYFDSAFIQKDSSKYWFEHYIKLKSKHVPDSINPYYKLLMRKK